jgi:hypothetical protein
MALVGTSQLMDDVGAVPAIVGDLGLAIAQAQTLMDHNYLDGIERLLAMSKAFLGAAAPAAAPAGGAAAAGADSLDAAKEAMVAILRALAPTRYQYTETTLTVRLDMARSVQASASLGVGANLGAVVVNAGLVLGYAYDYRGAAEVRTVIHAAPAGEHVFDALRQRAAAVNDRALELPPQSKVDQELINKAVALFDKISAVNVKDKIKIGASTGAN